MIRELFWRFVRRVAWRPATKEPQRRAPSPPRSITHYDVGKREPCAFCNGDEYALCTSDWLSVTCTACFAQRAPQGTPLSARERMLQIRAIGVGVTRPVTREELVADHEAMRRQNWRGEWYRT